MSKNARSAIACLAILCVFALLVGITTAVHDCAGCDERPGQPVARAASLN